MLGDCVVHTVRRCRLYFFSFALSIEAKLSIKCANLCDEASNREISIFWPIAKVYTHKKVIRPMSFRSKCWLGKLANTLLIRQPISGEFPLHSNSSQFGRIFLNIFPKHTSLWHTFPQWRFLSRTFCFILMVYDPWTLKLKRPRRHCCARRLEFSR